MCNNKKMRLTFHLNMPNMIQIAGAPAGKKGDEHSNMILCLTQTKKISLKRAFDKIVERVLDAEVGFQAFDCATGEIEMVLFTGKNK